MYETESRDNPGPYLTVDVHTSATATKAAKSSKGPIPRRLKGM